MTIDVKKDRSVSPVGLQLIQKYREYKKEDKSLNKSVTVD